MIEKNNDSSDLSVGTKGTWSGIVKKVIYYGQDDYAVILLSLSGGKEITAEGKLGQPIKNIGIKVTGAVKHNVKANEDQIHVMSCSYNISKENRAVMTFLNSLNGVGTKLASDIVNTLGCDIASYITDPDKLQSVTGISSIKAKSIIQNYETGKHLFPLYFLTGGQITLRQATNIYEQYKDKAEYVIKHNPYKMIYDMSGVGFTTADKLALTVGIKYDSKERINAALVYCMKCAQNNDGHDYLPKNILFDKTKEVIFSIKELKNVYYQDILLSAAVPDDLSEWESSRLYDLSVNHQKKLSNMLDNWAYDEKREKYCKTEKLNDSEIRCLDIFYEKRENLNDILKEVLKDTAFNATGMKSKDVVKQLCLKENAAKTLVIHEGLCEEPAIWEKSMYLTECNIAEIIASMIHQGSYRTVSDNDLDECINSDNEYELDKEQAEAVRKAIKNRISIVTGGPGRGKTTVIKKILSAWQKSKSDNNKPARAILLAPTGNAAKRMSNATGYTAMTIHRFILKNKEGITNDDTMVIIDEMSMTDIFLMQRVLTNIKRAQICLVGDVNQLPSVGPGKVLEDLIKSGKVPVTFLTKCHRNAGSILTNSEIVNNGGNLQELVVDNHSKTLWLDDSERIINSVAELYRRNLDKYSPKDMIVLTPMVEKKTGVNELNKMLRDIANPYKQTMKTFSVQTTVFRLGDRVMHTRNNYNLTVWENGKEYQGVFRGETGTIIAIEPYNSNYGLWVEFDDGRKAFYDSLNARDLNLAYALTYHKSQGSEYKCVICILTTGDFMLLQRKILYTGISRAKEMSFLIGNAKAFYMAMNDFSGQAAVRYTTLQKRLKEYI